MSLSLFFNPVEKPETSDTESLASHIHFYNGSSPFPDNTQALFFTVSVSSNDNFSSIRNSLYSLKELSSEIVIADVGHLRNAESEEATIERLEQAIVLLLSKDIPIIVVGDHHYLDLAAYKAAESLNTLIKVSEIDAIIDLQEETTKKNLGRLNQLFLHKPNYLADYCHIGSQRHLISKKILSAFEKISFPVVSLGKVKEKLIETEPYIRQADIVTIDLSAMKKSDFVHCNPNRIFGLSAEELAQFCWYAGNSPQLKIIGFWGYSSVPEATPEALAVSIWYIFEGLKKRSVNRLDLNNNNFTQYHVQFNDLNQSITFYKNESSEQWWMEVHYPRVNRRENTTYLPCSYRDYEEAMKGEIPERWIRAINQMI